MKRLSAVRTKALLVLLALALCAPAAAQQMYKCKDAAGKFTYSGQPCEDLGLSPGGEVKGKTSVAPAFKAPPKAPHDAAKAASAAKPSPAAKAAEAPKEPERRCFTVKTAKGTSTRCNDVPPDEAK